MPRALKALLVLAAALVVVTAGTLVWSLSAQSSDFAFVPRAAQPTLPAVTLEGQKPPPKGAGAVYFSTVGVRRATVYETWFGVGDGGELVPEHAVLSPGETDANRARVEGMLMDASQQAAEIVALRALGYDVRVRNAGVRVVGIEPQAPINAAGIQLGDVIVGVDGTAISTTPELRDAVTEAGADAAVRLRVHRGGDFLEITTKTTRRPDGTVLLGIVPGQARLVVAPRDVTFSIEGVGGPSAGLSFALQIYSAGKGYRDLDGLRVAATGSLDDTGRVGRVGGVAQKAIGAGRVDADLFLVPPADAAEARRAAPRDVKVVAVASFQEALGAIAAAAAS